MLTAEEQAFLKQALPFLQNITKEQRQLLYAGSYRRNFQKGDPIRSAEGECVGFFLVKSGQVRAFILSDSGKEVTLYRLFSRDFCLLSASCMMRNISFEVCLEAEKKTEVILIPPELYDTLQRQAPQVADYTNAVLSSRFSDVMWVMEEILFVSFDKRLASFLLEMSGIEGSDTLLITHDAIARNMGSAREVVTRMLKYFQSESMVRLFRGGIEIIDRKKLKKLCE